MGTYAIRYTRSIDEIVSAFFRPPPLPLRSVPVPRPFPRNPKTYTSEQCEPDRFSLHTRLITPAK